MRTAVRPGALGTIAAALALLALSGCALFGPGAPPVDVVWRVVEIDGAPLPHLPGGRAPTLVLDAANTRASGFTGCNRMTGGFVLAGKTLEFGNMASTRMACEAAGASVEMGYMEAIQSVASWRRIEEGLELLDSEGEVRMRLEEAGRVDALPPKE